MENRDRLRARQASLARRSRIVGVAQFAQIPLLNDHQLVARWRQELPPTYVSDSQELPIDPLPSGLYLIEATDGHFKAYTLLMVSRMAMITRTAGGGVLAYCVDRVSGAGIAGALLGKGYFADRKGRRHWPAAASQWHQRRRRACRPAHDRAQAGAGQLLGTGLFGQ